MSIIREKIRFNNSLVGLTGGTTGFTGTTMNLRISLSSTDNLIEYQQEIDRLTQFTTLDLVNPVTDGEERRFKLNPNPSANITLVFWFYSGSSYSNDFLAAGFTPDEIFNKSLNLLNSFFVLDFYDTFDINNQTKIFTTYLTKVLVPTSGAYYSQYVIGTNSNNQLYRWYVPISYFSGTTMTGYVKLSFFNAKTGKITTFFNNDNMSLTTPEYMFFKAQLDRNNMTWKFLTTSYPTITAKQIINNILFAKKVNDTVANKDDLKQNPPSGNTFVVSSNSAGYGSTTKLTPVIPTEPTLGTLTITNIVSNNANGNSSVTSEGGSGVYERGFIWSISPNPTIDDNKVVTTGGGLGLFTANMFPLTFATTYYVRAYAINNVDVGYSNEISFTTLPIAPLVVSDMVGTVTSNSATLQGHIDNTGGAAITAEGFMYGSNPSYLTTNVSAILAPVNFYTSASPLASNTTYYYKAYATNSAGTGYGGVISFTTPVPPPPIVTTIYALDITMNTAIIRAGVAYTGSDPIIERGVAWGTYTNPDLTNKTTNGTGAGNFDTTITGLVPNQLYYVRAYVLMGSAPTSPIYGNQISFTTSPPSPPTLGAFTVTDIASNNANGNSSVTNDGGATVYGRGFVWNTSPSPTTANSKVTSGTGTGAFTANMWGLTFNTTYYARAYASNSAGISYSNEISFTTLPVAPAVSTQMVSSITSSSATGNGKIESDGGAIITAEGFKMGNSSGNYPITIPAILAPVNFYEGLGTLVGSTTYYLKAYATNSIGTGYGGEVSFTTLAPPAPVVTTVYSLDITMNTAIIRAGIAYTGNHVISERGVVWATYTMPDQSSSKQTNGTGAGNFDTTITGLVPNQLYYVRAYAYTTEDGYIYGNQISLTTLPALPPTLGTFTVTDIASNNANGNSSVTNDGGATVYGRGFVWNTSPSPTTANSKVTSGTGTGAFSGNMFPLTFATTYYARAYASNSAGVTYSNEISFTTLPTAPVVTTQTVSSITSNSATGNGRIENNGGAAITAEGFVMGTNPSYLTTNITAILAPVDFYEGLGSLVAGTIYYLKAYATNSIGTSYGSITSFTTPVPAPPTVTTIYFGHTTSTAKIKTGVAYTGPDSIIDSGVVWATSTGPDQSSNNIHHGAMTGSGYFDITISGLSTGLTYYARSYIFMGSAPSSPIYGNEVSFILT